MRTVTRAINKAKENTFSIWKTRMKVKFEKLSNKIVKRNVISKNRVKPVTLNLCDDEIPNHHKELLDMGPKFVPVQKRIPYMDIITATETTALKMKFDDKNNETNAMKLRQNVLRDLKMARPPKDNLTKDQRITMKEIKSDEVVRIYPYDKGSGLVRIKSEDALSKIQEQIGNATIVNKDPTPRIARRFQNALREIKKQGRIDDKLYERLYPSDPIPPRMYGTVQAHKPEKDYPMRIVVSTVGTPSYKTSEHLVQLSQPILNKNDM